MDNEFLSDCLTISIEKAIAKKFSSKSIINDINAMKERWTQLLKLKVNL